MEQPAHAGFLITKKSCLRPRRTGATGGRADHQQLCVGPQVRYGPGRARQAAEREPPDPFDCEEVEKIIDHAHTNFAPTVANLIAFRFFSGLRILLVLTAQAACPWWGRMAKRFLTRGSDGTVIHYGDAGRWRPSNGQCPNGSVWFGRTPGSGLPRANEHSLGLPKTLTLDAKRQSRQKSAQEL